MHPYVDAGIITDTLGQDGGNSKSVNMQEIYARFDDYKERLLPQLPGMAKKHLKHCYPLEVVCHIL